MRQPHSEKVLWGHVFAAEGDDDQSQQKTERRGRLNPARRITALVRTGVFGDVGCRPAVLAAECQALRETQSDEQNRGKPSDLGEGGQQADQEGRCAHHHDGDEEGVFAADEVADAAEDQRAERAHEKARRIRRESRQQCRRVVPGREEQRGEERRQHRVEIEIIPFEYRAERRGENDEFFLARHAPGPDVFYDVHVENSSFFVFFFFGCFLGNFFAPAPPLGGGF